MKEAFKVEAIKKINIYLWGKKRLQKLLTK